MKRRWLLAFLPLFTALAARWAEWQERRIARLGRALSVEETEVAVRMGVTDPQRLRLMEVVRIPWLNGRLVRILARFFPQVSASTVGLSLRYGIFLREPFAKNLQLLAHECVHTAQYERLGGIEEFLECYFRECLDVGYFQSPLEREAVEKSAMVAS